MVKIPSPLGLNTKCKRSALQIPATARCSLNYTLRVWQQVVNTDTDRWQHWEFIIAAVDSSMYNDITEDHHSNSQVFAFVTLMVSNIGDHKVCLRSSVQWHNIQRKFHWNLFNRSRVSWYTWENEYLVLPLTDASTIFSAEIYDRQT